MFQFDIKKTIQAAGVLLRKESGHENYMRLLKLLYLADRQSIQETGRPITGDRVVAMKNGPVLSRVYDYIRHGMDAEWTRYFETERYDIAIRRQPDIDLLSKQDIDILENTSKIYWDRGPSDMVDLTHELPEWKENAVRAEDVVKVRDIRYEDILEAVGMSDHVESIRQDAQTEAELNELFGAVV
jgi:uncharacterized phage-associated protein